VLQIIGDPGDRATEADFRRDAPNVRYLHLATAAHDKPAKEIVAGMMGAVRAFRRSSTQTDDITIAVIKREASLLRL
jgi:serine phosphatase RsbU (regulator of sigma subunit)